VLRDNDRRSCASRHVAFMEASFARASPQGGKATLPSSSPSVTTSSSASESTHTSEQSPAAARAAVATSSGAVAHHPVLRARGGHEPHDAGGEGNAASAGAIPAPSPAAGTAQNRKVAEALHAAAQRQGSGFLQRFAQRYNQQIYAQHRLDQSVTV
jgi:hypothetical protein